MDLAGYPMASQRFYDFAARVIEKEGYLLHKYNLRGTPGMSETVRSCPSRRMKRLLSSGRFGIISLFTGTSSS
jgi:predicted methyltransferase